MNNKPTLYSLSSVKFKNNTPPPSDKVLFDALEMLYKLSEKMPNGGFCSLVMNIMGGVKSDEAHPVDALGRPLDTWTESRAAEAAVFSLFFLMVSRGVFTSGDMLKVLDMPKEYVSKWVELYNQALDDISKEEEEVMLSSEELENMWEG